MGMKIIISIKRETSASTVCTCPDFLFCCCAPSVGYLGYKYYPDKLNNSIGTLHTYALCNFASKLYDSLSKASEADFARLLNMSLLTCKDDYVLRIHDRTLSPGKSVRSGLSTAHYKSKLMFLLYTTVHKFID